MKDIDDNNECCSYVLSIFILTWYPNHRMLQITNFVYFSGFNIMKYCATTLSIDKAHFKLIVLRNVCFYYIFCETSNRPTKCYIADSITKEWNNDCPHQQNKRGKKRNMVFNSNAWFVRWTILADYSSWQCFLERAAFCFVI